MPIKRGQAPIWAYQQPPYGSTLDWAHPLTNGLVGRYLLNEVPFLTSIDNQTAWDLTGQNNLTFNSSSSGNWKGGAGPLGLGPQATGQGTDTTNQSAAFASGTVVADTDPLSVSIWLAMADNDNFKRCYSARGRDTGANAAWSFHIEGSAPPNRTMSCAVITTSGGAAQTTASGTTVVGGSTPYNLITVHVVGVWDPGKSVKLYTNGQLDATTSTTKTTLRSANATYPNFGVLGWTSDVTPPAYAAPAIYYTASVYRRAITASEAEWLYEEPYADILPPDTRRWFVSATVAATVNYKKTRSRIGTKVGSRQAGGV